MAVLKIKVIPNAKKSCFVDWFSGQTGEALRIRLAAPPVDGKANKALITFLSKALSVRKSQIGIKNGGKNRNKVIEISGLSDSDLRTLVDSLLKSS